MNAPKEEKPADLKAKLRTGMIAAVKLNEKPIPAERQHDMAGKTISGMVIGGVGLIVMTLGLLALYGQLQREAASLMLLIGSGALALVGLFIFGAGANVASNGVFTEAIGSLKEPLQMVVRFYRAFRGIKEDGATP